MEVGYEGRRRCQRLYEGAEAVGSRINARGAEGGKMKGGGAARSKKVRGREEELTEVR